MGIAASERFFDRGEQASGIEAGFYFVFGESLHTAFQ
jgi:hypothetical protein